MVHASAARPAPRQINCMLSETESSHSITIKLFAMIGGNKVYRRVKADVFVNYVIQT